MTVPYPFVLLTEDDSGESYFTTGEISRTLRDFAPPATPFFVSAVENASGYVVIRLPGGWAGEPHPSPHRQILFCLSGALRVTASDGDSRIIKTGDAFLMEDTRGNGHRSEVISKEPVDAVIVQLPMEIRTVASAN
jgi:hypothetical protein